MAPLTDAWDAYWGRVDLLDATGCWPIDGARNGSGYASAAIAGKRMGAHVASVLYSGRQIPPVTEVDHLCKNRICVNPSHLEVVTGYENNMRSDSVTAVNRRKTHCKNGHEFTAENTHLDMSRAGGKIGRTCRACHAERERNRRQRLKEEKLYALPEAA